MQKFLCSTLILGQIGSLKKTGQYKTISQLIQSLKFNHLNSNFGTQVPSYIRNKKNCTFENLKVLREDGTKQGPRSETLLAESQ